MQKSILIVIKNAILDLYGWGRHIRWLVVNWSSGIPGQHLQLLEDLLYTLLYYKSSKL